MHISIIAAIGKNRELGKNNKLLWNIREDKIRFRDLTLHHTIIMGRITFESLVEYYRQYQKPLPDRNHIIVTKNNDFQPKADKCFVVHSLVEAIDLAKTTEKEEIFIAGGGQIYTQALPFADKLYLTVVDAKFDADTFFPDYSQFSKIIAKNEHESDGYRYTFFELTK